MARRRQALLLPGRNYGVQGPLLMFAHVALQSRGAHIYPMEWQRPEQLTADVQTMVDGVCDQVEAALDHVHDADPPTRRPTATRTGANTDPPTRRPTATRTGANTDPPLLVGKSLGSAAAVLAAHHGLPAIWFTPLLQDYPIVQALRRATAPYLLVGGTADPAWNSALARELPGEVCEIAGADHGMFMPGRPLVESAYALADIVGAIETFIDTAVWPRRG